jgi:hypothetical protein
MRHVRETPRLRLARGVASGAICGTGALAAHRLGGGAVPGLSTVMILLAVSLALGVALTGSGSSRLRTAGGAVLAQLCWHGLLVTTTGCAGGFDGCRSAWSQVVMLAGHVCVAAVAVAVSLGADRILVRLGHQLADGMRAALLLPRPALARVWARPTVPGLVALRSSLVSTRPAAPRGPPYVDARLSFA